jgi:hypothetical protein
MEVFPLTCGCGFGIESPVYTDYRMVDGELRFPYCPRCGRIMSNRVQSVARPGDYEHISDSLAIHPDQISEHRKLFPHIEVLPDGRPKFTSPRQQELYANACGFDKKTQRNRRKGVRI